MLLIFLHIHKTGGTSFSHALRWGTAFGKRHWVPPTDAQGRSFKSMPRAERKRIRLLQGHFLFGIHEAYPGPTAYVTMMRDPVARIVSSYYYTIKTFPETTLRDMPIEAFARGESIHREQNAQARRIAGVRKDEIDHVSVDALYERAVENIENDFACVGLVERFDESLILMHHLLEWTAYPLYLREKTEVKRPRGDEIPASTRQAIGDANSADMRLYAFVQDRLDQQVARADIDLQHHIHRFQRLNRWYQSLAPPVARAYRALFR